MTVSFTRLEVGEIIRALDTREAFVKSREIDPAHGVAMNVAELPLIDDIRNKLNEE